MKIQEYLMNQPVVRKYADKYTAPLIKFEHGVPEKYLDGWFKTKPSVDEIALFYLGVCRGKRHDDMPGILAALKKYKGLDVPVVEGILTESWWRDWSHNNTVELMEARDDFIFARW